MGALKKAMRALSRVVRAVPTAWHAVLVLLSLAMVVVGIVQIFHGHDDPSRAGVGRLHTAFLQPQPCSSDQSAVCSYEKAVKLDLPNGKTEVENQDALYDLVRREGPVTVQVEWIKDLHSATRVLYKDRWYRAAYPGDASVVESVLLVFIGVVALFYSGAAFADALPDSAGEAAGKAEPSGA